MARRWPLRQSGVLRLFASRPRRLRRGHLDPEATRWNSALGEYVLAWDDVRSAPDPHSYALEFARSAFQHACLVCGWDEKLAASAEGAPPAVT